MVTFRRLAAVLALSLLALQEAVAAWYGGGAAWLFAAFAISLTVAAIAVQRRLLWGRWLGLGAGLTGLAGALVLLPLTPAPELWAITVLGAAVLLSLAGRRMAEHYVERLPAASSWRQLAASTRLRWLAAAIVTSVPAVAMLLVAGVVQGFSAILVITTSLVAAGAILATFERGAGVVLLGAGGLCAAALAIDQLHLLTLPHALMTTPQLVADLAVPALLAAGSAGVIAFASFARPLLRVLRT